MLQALIIIQTIIHNNNNIFKSGQARVNSEYYVIKCVGGQKYSITNMDFYSCCVLFFIYQAYKSLLHSVNYLIFAQKNTLCGIK